MNWKQCKHCGSGIKPVYSRCTQTKWKYERSLGYFYRCSKCLQDAEKSGLSSWTAYYRELVLKRHDPLKVYRLVGDQISRR